MCNSDIDKYEKAVEKQNRENGLIPNKEEFERKTFTQERDFFRERINEIEEEQIKLNSQNDAILAESKILPEEAQQQKSALELKKKFFEQKLQRVEHDLFILNKSKYDIPKYATFA